MSEIYWVLLLANALFYISFQPVVALLDGFTLEMLEFRRSRFSFGTIRTFGIPGTFAAIASCLMAVGVLVFFFGRMLDESVQESEH